MIIGADSETYPIEPGIPAPKGVVGSWFDGTNGLLEWHREFCQRLAVYLATPGVVIAGANIAYDFGVVLRDRPDLINLIFAKYDTGEVWEIFVAQALHDVAEGHLFEEPGGRPMRSRGSDGQPFGKIRQRYALDLCAWLVLGIANSKANDEYKLRYREFEGVPFEQWPETASLYPLDDARDTQQIAVKQQTYRNQGPIEQYVPGAAGQRTFGWTHHTHQARAAFAMHLASMWGLRANGPDAEALAAKIEGETVEQIKALVYGGPTTLLNENGERYSVTLRGGCLKDGINKRGVFVQDDYGKEDRKVIKTRVAIAYGANVENLCPLCKGTGKVLSPKSHNPINCVRFLPSGEKEVTCDSTGLLLPYTVPRADGGGVSINRDTLEESADVDLEALAEIGPLETIRDRFVPWLREGARVPINTRPNVIVETARASYDGIIQTLPRKGGVRECIEARHDIDRVFAVPDDFVCDPSEVLT